MGFAASVDGAIGHVGRGWMDPENGEISMQCDAFSAALAAGMLLNMPFAV